MEHPEAGQEAVQRLEQKPETTLEAASGLGARHRRALFLDRSQMRLRLEHGC